MQFRHYVSEQIPGVAPFHSFWNRAVSNRQNWREQSSLTIFTFLPPKSQTGTALIIRSEEKKLVEIIKNTLYSWAGDKAWLFAGMSTFKNVWTEQAQSCWARADWLTWRRGTSRGQHRGSVQTEATVCRSTHEACWNDFMLLFESMDGQKASDGAGFQSKNKKVNKTVLNNT